MACMDIILRDILLKDLEDYYHWNHPDRKFHKYNGPYFKQKTKDELKLFVKLVRDKLTRGDKHVLKNKKLIADKRTDHIIGAVNWYWKSEETLWMEIGIVIFNENYWGKGIGDKAFKQWIQEVFTTNPDIIRLGLSTWSGNKRMIRLAEKLGFLREAVYRKARIVDHQYYDSISYGILREEWETNMLQNRDWTT